MDRENHYKYMGRVLLKYSDWDYPDKDSLTDIQLRLRGFCPLEDPGAPDLREGERLEMRYKYLDKDGKETKSLWYGVGGVAEKLVVEYRVVRNEEQLQMMDAQIEGILRPAEA